MPLGSLVMGEGDMAADWNLQYSLTVDFENLMGRGTCTVEAGFLLLNGPRNGDIPNLKRREIFARAFTCQIAFFCSRI
jgi:hypothetical protein